ncbi:hypothetical protein CL621_04975 [archaeon]|nr:hypothetical protein [archaeon]
MGKKKGKKKRVVKFDIKKTLAFKLLIVSLILLFILVIIWIFVWKPSEDVEEGYGLPALKWDFDVEEVVFSVLDYNITTITTDNDTVEINVEWSSGNKSINQILIDFEGIPNYCNYTQINDLSFGENKTYSINYGSGTFYCNESSFENVSSISIYAEVHINLTQTSLIDNITIYNDDSLVDVVDLDDYFNSLANISYSVVGDSEYKTGLGINDTTNLVSFDPKLDRYGSYGFNLTATDTDGEVLDVSTNGENMTFYVIFVDDDAPIPNEALDFNRTECDDLLWNKDTSYELNMTKCWSDGDGDTISGYRYENRSNGKVNINQNGSILTLNPDSDWNGSGYFYIRPIFLINSL